MSAVGKVRSRQWGASGGIIRPPPGGPAPGSGTHHHGSPAGAPPGNHGTAPPITCGSGPRPVSLVGASRIQLGLGTVRECHLPCTRCFVLFGDTSGASIHHRCCCFLSCKLGDPSMRYEPCGRSALLSLDFRCSHYTACGRSSTRRAENDEKNIDLTLPGWSDEALCGSSRARVLAQNKAGPCLQPTRLHIGWRKQRGPTRLGRCGPARPAWLTQAAHLLAAGIHGHPPGMRPTTPNCINGAAPIPAESRHHSASQRAVSTCITLLPAYS